MEEFENGLTEEENKALIGEPETVIEEVVPVVETVANPEGEVEKETPTVPPAEDKTNEKGEGSEPENTPEEKLPFHKHPRWIAQQNREKALEAEIAAQNEKLASLESRIPVKEEETPQIPDMPEWFVAAYGDDPELWEKYYSIEAQKEIEREERLLAKIEERTSQKAEEEKKSLEWVDTQLASVRESLKDGEPDFEDNALLKVVTDFRPTDEEGNLNFRAAYDILQKMGTVAPVTKIEGNGSIQDKKRLASHTPASGGEPTIETVTTSEQLSNDPPW